MKKALALVGAGALVLVLVVPVLAFYSPHHHHGPRVGNRIEIENEDVTVVTKVETQADSGDNRIGGMWVKGGRIVTGDALASSVVTTDVNTSGVTCRSCRRSVEIENEDVTVVTKVEAQADSGDNRIGGMLVRGGVVRTGAASAGSDVYSVVNYSVVGGLTE